MDCKLSSLVYFLLCYSVAVVTSKSAEGELIRTTFMLLCLIFVSAVLILLSIAVESWNSFHCQLVTGKSRKLDCDNQCYNAHS